MTQLSPEAAALLEDARRTHGPSESDRERVLHSLHLSLGIAVPAALVAGTAQAAGATHALGASSLGATHATAVQAASAAQATGLAQAGMTQAAAGPGMLASKSALSFGAKLLTWKAGKVLLATVALGGAVGVSRLPRAATVESDKQHTHVEQTVAPRAARDHDERGEAQASPVAASEAPDRAAALPAGAPATRPDPEPVAAREDEASEAAPAVALASSQERGPRRRAHAQAGRARARVQTAQLPLASRASPQTSAASEELAPTPPAPEAHVPAESQLIRSALTSLRDHDAVMALVQLEEHATRYPGGAFATERRGLHVIALCQAGRVSEGRVEKAAFLSMLGSAPIAARVRTACIERKP